MCLTAKAAGDAGLLLDQLGSVFDEARVCVLATGAWMCQLVCLTAKAVSNAGLLLDQLGSVFDAVRACVY